MKSKLCLPACLLSPEFLFKRLKKAPAGIAYSQLNQKKKFVYAQNSRPIFFQQGSFSIRVQIGRFL